MISITVVHALYQVPSSGMLTTQTRLCEMSTETLEVKYVQDPHLEMNIHVVAAIQCI